MITAIIITIIKRRQRRQRRQQLWRQPQRSDHNRLRRQRKSFDPNMKPFPMVDTDSRKKDVMLLKRLCKTNRFLLLLAATKQAMDKLATKSAISATMRSLARF